MLTMEAAARELSSAEFDAFHASEHPEPVPGCFACKLESVQVSASIHAPRATRVAPRAPALNSWERGVAGEHRSDGSFMPYLNPDLSPIGVHQFAGKRGIYEAAIEKNRTGAATPAVSGGGGS